MNPSARSDAPFSVIFGMTLAHRVGFAYKQQLKFTQTMEKQKIEIELTLDQLTQLEYVASLANRDTEEYARDILVVFLTQITAPIVNLPKTKTEDE